MADETTKTEETQEVSLEELQLRIAQLEKDNEKLKAATTNASADASRYKKELQSRMSEQERKDAEEAEEKRKLMERLEELEAERRNEKGRAGFIGVGFAESAAKDAVDAFYSGDAEAFTALLKGFLVEHDKSIKAESVRNTVAPASGGTQPITVTKEQFEKMSYRELNELYAKDPEQYQRLKNS